MPNDALDQEVFCPVLWRDLEKLDPETVARLSGAERTATGFNLKFFGRNHRLDSANQLLVGPPDLRAVGFVKTMVVLSYLVKSAQGPAPGLANELVGPWTLPGGSVFFRGPHALPMESLVEVFGQDPEGFLAKALALGADAITDTAFRFRVLPFVELGCYLDPADEEFPARISWSFDRYAHYYLALDGLWGLALALVSEMVDGPSPLVFS